MKVVVISDIHGRTKWKQQIEEPADLYIFIGDYFDSFNINGEKQIENFKDIQEFYRQNKDKVILLAGNHDNPNYGCPNFDGSCAGFQSKYAYMIRNLLEPMREAREIQVCKVIKNYVFSHAGITQTWCENHGIRFKNLEKDINNLFHKDLYSFIFIEDKKATSLRYTNACGDNVWQSPMWTRPQSLYQDKIPNYIQVVGHTAVHDLTLKNDIWLTDCQEFTDNFLILEI